MQALAANLRVGFAMSGKEALVLTAIGSGCTMKYPILKTYCGSQFDIEN